MEVQTLEYSKMFISLLNKSIGYSQSETKSRNDDKEQSKMKCMEGPFMKGADFWFFHKIEKSVLWCLFGSPKSCVSTVSLAPYSVFTIQIKLCKKFLFCYQAFEITLSATEILNISIFQLVLPQECDNLNNF